MKKVSIGIAFLSALCLSDARPERYNYSGAQLQYQPADQMLIAGSGDNPWARPDPRQYGGRLPDYITNPRYATEEDRQTKLNFGDRQQPNAGAQQQQQPQQQPGYGAGMALPQMPYIYSPYSGMLYGYPQAYPTYPASPTSPGLGGVPGVGRSGRIATAHTVGERAILDRTGPSTVTDCEELAVPPRER